MPIRTILIRDDEMKRKINRLAGKYNLSALIRREIMKRYHDNNNIENIDIKRVRGRRGGMLYGNMMKIYMDEMTARLLEQVRKREKKFNFSEFCREVFEKFEED